MFAKDSCAKCLVPSDGAIGTGGPFKRRGLAVGGEVIGDVHFRGTLAFGLSSLCSHSP